MTSDKIRRFIEQGRKAQSQADIITNAKNRGMIAIDEKGNVTPKQWEELDRIAKEANKPGNTLKGALETARKEGKIAGYAKVDSGAMEIDKLVNVDKPKGGRNYVPNGKGRGGNRGGGRPPVIETLVKRGVKQWFEDHYNEKIPVEITDPKTGIKKIIQKTRMMVATETLFRLGTGTSTKGNADAMSKWLDRMVGRPAQPIRGDEADDNPIRLSADINTILEKAYGDDIDNEDGPSSH